MNTKEEVAFFVLTFAAYSASAAPRFATRVSLETADLDPKGVVLSREATTKAAMVVSGNSFGGEVDAGYTTVRDGGSNKERYNLASLSYRTLVTDGGACRVAASIAPRIMTARNKGSRYELLAVATVAFRKDTGGVPLTDTIGFEAFTAGGISAGNIVGITGSRRIDWRHGIEFVFAGRCGYNDHLSARFPGFLYSRGDAIVRKRFGRVAFEVIVSQLSPFRGVFGPKTACSFATACRW